MSKHKQKIQDKMFVVRKYILAKSAKEAIKKDKITEVEDCYIDQDYKNNEFGFRK